MAQCNYLLITAPGKHFSEAICRTEQKAQFQAFPMRTQWLICWPYLEDQPQPHPPLHRLSASPGSCNTALDSGIYNQLAPPAPCSFCLLVTSRLEKNEKQQLLLTNKARTLPAGTKSLVKACPICRLSQTMTQNTRRQDLNLRKALIHQGVLQGCNFGDGRHTTASLPRANLPFKKKKKEKKKKGEPSLIR